MHKVLALLAQYKVYKYRENRQATEGLFKLRSQWLYLSNWENHKKQIKEEIIKSTKEQECRLLELKPEVCNYRS